MNNGDLDYYNEGLDEEHDLKDVNAGNETAEDESGAGYCKY